MTASGSGSVQDVAGFLGSRPPFDAVSADDLARVAAVTQTEVSPRGTTIFHQGAGPVEDLRMVRSGSVEVVLDGRVLDLLGPGELFGQASMISGLPTGFEARAGEDTVCYRIPADVVRPLLARPDVLAFVARSIVSRPPPIAPPPADPGQRRVAALIRRPPLLCPGDVPIRAAAQQMTAAGVSAVLVRHGATVGIVTDRDLRSRVIAAGRSPDEPVSAVMTEPAYTVSADRLGGDVLLDMLERNIHHIPVLSPAGEVLGVVDDGDLVAAEGRMPLLLRRAIGLAQTQADLAAAAAGLNPALVALRDAQVPAEQVAAVRSVVLDALIRRLAELAVRDAGPAPVPFTWFALGSLARREAVPSSDVDSALAWAGDDGAAGYGRRLAGAVNDGLRACGLPPDPQGANAASPLFARSLTSWQALERSLSGDPTQDKALIMASLITDSRPVFSTGPLPGGGLWRVSPDHPDLSLAAGPVRPVVPAAHRVLARVRGRALRRAARAARPQARRADPDRRPGPLGRDGRGGDQRLHHGPAARGRGGRDAGRAGGADADGGVRLHLLAAPGPSGRAVAPG